MMVSRPRIDCSGNEAVGWVELKRLSLRLHQIESSPLSCPRDRSILQARVADLKDLIEAKPVEVDLRDAVRSETDILRSQLAELRRQCAH